MSNWFAVHKQTKLIVKIIASSSKPKDSKDAIFFLATDKALDTYYKHFKPNAPLLDIGFMMNKHPYLMPK